MSLKIVQWFAAGYFICACKVLSTDCVKSVVKSYSWRQYLKLRAGRAFKGISIFYCVFYI